MLVCTIGKRIHKRDHRKSGLALNFVFKPYVQNGAHLKLKNKFDFAEPGSALNQ